MSKKIFALIGDVITKHPILVSLLTALAAVLLAAGHVGQRESKLMKVSSPVSVVVLSRNVSEGELLNDASLMTAQVPQRFAEPGAFENVGLVRGRVAAIDIPKGTQVTLSNSRLLEEVGGLSAIIPSGGRAFSFPVDEGITKLVHPGDWVDVIATFDLGGDAFVKRTTLTLASGVQILAVGRDIVDLPRINNQARERTGIFSQQAVTQASSHAEITVSVTPKQAQDIAFAMQTGALNIAVAPFGGENPSLNVVPTTISTIVGGYSDVVPLKKNFREFKGR